MTRITVTTPFVEVPEELFEHMMHTLSDAERMMRGMCRALEGETGYEHTASDIDELAKRAGWLAREAGTGLSRGGFYSVAFVPSGVHFCEPCPTHRNRSTTRIYGYDSFFNDEDGEGSDDNGTPNPPTEEAGGTGDDGTPNAPTEEAGGTGVDGTPNPSTKKADGAGIDGTSTEACTSQG